MYSPINLFVSIHRPNCVGMVILRADLQQKSHQQVKIKKGFRCMRHKFRANKLSFALKEVQRVCVSHNCIHALSWRRLLTSAASDAGAIELDALCSC
jgi:hypothetical protein